MKKKNQNQNRIRALRGTLAFSLAALLCMPGALPTARAFAQEELFESAAAHVHTQDCYSVGSHLICGLEESPGHQHDLSCWEAIRGELLCTDDSAEHVHSDECYDWSTELTCGAEEGEGAHKHGEECYEQERVLICGYEDAAGEAETAAEEIVTEESYEVVEITETPEPTMNPGNGITSCLQLERELVFADECDPTADLEDETDWWRMFADMELSGDWAEDLLKVAQSQVGYTESELNYVAEDPWHPKGYTRYGAWFGIPYGDWCAMFISFCMYYAEIPDSAVPYNCHCSEWVRELRERGLYHNWDEDYKPKRGDFVFFDFDSDEKAEHVGIIRDVDTDKGWIYTIEGNRYDYVEEFVLTKYDYAIIGYCELPENPNYDPANPGVVRQNGEVELPPDPVEPEPPAWDNVRDAAAGVRFMNITPTVVESRVNY